MRHDPIQSYPGHDAGPLIAGAAPRVSPATSPVAVHAAKTKPANVTEGVTA